SNPANILHVAYWTNSAAAAHSVTGSGNYLYAAAGTTRLHIFDIGGAVIAQEKVGTAQIGNLLVDNNAQILGDIHTKGSVNVGENMLVNGMLTVNGISGTTTPNGVATTSAVFIGNVGIGTT